MSHSARSAWIETPVSGGATETGESHSARSAWIETSQKTLYEPQSDVALRKECVD